MRRPRAWTALTACLLTLGCLSGRAAAAPAIGDASGETKRFQAVKILKQVAAAGRRD
jgi:hypothetical protein